MWKKKLIWNLFLLICMCKSKRDKNVMYVLCKVNENKIEI